MQSQNYSPSSLADQVRLLPEAERLQRIQSLSEEEAEAILFDWDFWARPEQKLPSGDWQTWLILSGRGWGKTRCGAETVRQWVKDFPLVNLIGATADDARDILIQGESGILAICPKDERPRYLKSERSLLWPNGAKSLIFTADEPERLRGKQHCKLFCDELAAWRYCEESWDQAMLGLRLGSNPQAIVTTTPKPIPQVKSLVSSASTFVTRGTTYENRANLSPKFFSHVITKYEDTRLGRQELLAEILEDNPGALWNHALIDKLRIRLNQLPTLVRIVVGVDPAVSSNETSDEAGIVVAGQGPQWPPHYYVLDDLTANGPTSPDAWGNAAILGYNKHSADRIVAEVNQGGDLVESLLRGKDMHFAYKAVHATRGKVIRAEPIAALYEQGRIHHVGMFGSLEDEMCDFNPALIGVTVRGKKLLKSPNRMDALVWALTELSSGAGQLGVADYLKKEQERIAETGQLKPPEPEAKPHPSEVNAEPQPEVIPVCPQCQSASLSRGKQFGVVVVTCNSCGHSWEEI